MLRLAAPRPRGFTLTEMVITLVVLLILLAVAAPAMHQWVQATEIRTAADALQNGLQQARQEALHRNSQVQLALTGNTWTISVVSPAATLMSRANTDSPNAVLSGPATTIFNGLGRVTPAPAGVLTYNVTNPNGGDCTVMRCLNVTVQPGGQTRMCDPKLATTDPQAC